MFCSELHPKALLHNSQQAPPRCPNRLMPKLGARTLCLPHITLPFLLSPGIDGMLCRCTMALEMYGHTAYSAAADTRLVVMQCV